MKKFKKLKDGFCSLTFHNYCGNIELSANWDNVKQKWYMPMFHILDGPSIGDAPSYMYGEFLKKLKKYAAKKNNNAFKYFTDKIDEPFAIWLTRDRAEDMIELLESSKELGWDKL